MQSLFAVALLFSVAALQLTSAEVCAGCPVDADPTVVKEVTPMVHGALKKFNSNLGNPHELLKITHVKTQVVAGVKYIVDMETVGGQDKVVRKCTMVLLSQPWIEKEPQMLSFTCQDKVKRALLGGLKSIPESEMDSVKELASFAVKTLDDIDADDQMRVVEEILDAKKQLVNGIMYHLKLIVKVTSCKEGNVNDDCLKSEVSERKLCSLNIHRSWADKSPLNAKVVKSECEPMVGAPVERDHNNEYIQRIANLAVNHVSNMINSVYQQGLVRILKATTQVVAGYNVHLTFEIDETDCKKSSKPVELCTVQNRNPQICDVQVYDKPWMKETSVTLAKCYPKRVKRAVFGGETVVDPTDASIQEVALFAVSDIDAKSNSGDYKFGLGEIIEARKQVVSGLLYNIKMSLGLSSCQKSSEDNKCFSSDPHMICTVKVWDQPWLNKRTVESSNCEDKRSKRTLVGGEKVVEVDEAKVPELKSYLGEELTSRSNSPFKKTVVKVLEIRTQVVSGTLTKVTAEVADTTCLKTDTKQLSECQDNNQSHQVCTITIWDQPWLGKKEITHSECHSLTNGQTSSSREKRSFYEARNTLEQFQQFEDFRKTHNKKYLSPEEYEYRFSVFRANMLIANKLQETELGTATYGATQFADLTRSEFKKYLGFNGKLAQKSMGRNRKMATIPDIELPTEFDWRDKGVVTEVKNQGSCGSCWAFSVTGNIEGQYAIKHGNLVSLSEQELVDCDSYDNGCNGGLFDTAFHSIEDMGGLETEREYPYTGVQSNTCKFNRSEVRVSITGSVNISNDEVEMAKWLVQNGPISIALNANAMQFYMGGVSHPLKFLCSPNNLDHGVLIVGFGVHKGTWFHRNKLVPYWIIKNSWGQRWGRQGYYLLYRGSGTCGVNKMPTSATLE